MNPDLPQDEPNYKALYTELKGEVLEKVGPFARVGRLRSSPGCRAVWGFDGETVTDDDFRALSSLHEKLSSIGGSSSTETAASLADGKLTAGEAQQKSDWRTIDSAPRDGTDLLLYGKCEHDGRAYAADRNVGWCCEESPTGWMGRDLPIRPTHWMPLPPPPARGEP